MTIEEFEELTWGYLLVELFLEFNENKSPILEESNDLWLSFCSNPHRVEDLKDSVLNEDWESIFEENGMKIEKGESYYVKVLYKECKDSDDYRYWIYYEGIDYFVSYNINDVSIEKMDNTPLSEEDKELTLGNLFG